MSDMSPVQIDLAEASRVEKAVEVALVARQAWLNKVCPIGSFVNFDHNGHKQVGEVIEQRRGSSHNFADVRVRNVKTGKVRWVTLFQIRLAYGQSYDTM